MFMMFDELFETVGLVNYKRRKMWRERERDPTGANANLLALRGKREREGGAGLGFVDVEANDSCVTNALGTRPLCLCINIPSHPPINNHLPSFHLLFLCSSPCCLLGLASLSLSLS